MRRTHCRRRGRKGQLLLAAWLLMSADGCAHPADATRTVSPGCALAPAPDADARCNSVRDWLGADRVFASSTAHVLVKVWETGSGTTGFQFIDSDTCEEKDESWNQVLGDCQGGLTLRADGNELICGGLCETGVYEAGKGRQTRCGPGEVYRFAADCRPAHIDEMPQSLK
jgi:hypothetical protein